MTVDTFVTGGLADPTMGQYTTFGSAWSQNYDYEIFYYENQDRSTRATTPRTGQDIGNMDSRRRTELMLRRDHGKWEQRFLCV